MLPDERGRLCLEKALEPASLRRRPAVEGVEHGALSERESRNFLFELRIRQSHGRRDRRPGREAAANRARELGRCFLERLAARAPERVAQRLRQGSLVETNGNDWLCE